MTQFATFHDLAGKSVFITGGGAGIGASLTDGFMAAGASVSFVQRSDATGFCDEMEAKHGTRPHFMKCDITDVDLLKACMDEGAAKFGPITVLVNNAANDTRHDTLGYSVEDWDWNHAVNLRPHFFTAQHAVPGMRAAGGGAIINFSSASYGMGNAGYPAYVASKAAILGLTRAHAREFGPDKIRVNALVPGWVLTERQMELWATEDGLREHLAGQCLKEHLVPQDIVDATLFLASNASRMMTAQAMVVDGGVVFTG
ncbi:NAD(P)-dependent dehydrogenase, short-chain alcohol dehydrogenase family [Monaibacterium marinum]|uniref:NAD(P)-dependent dehydrogenase, short-chain alcohol dehydrogenase family n=1 Tax=Pontivivens marinum TaxID=1690039 RepID=A0A2C9CV09_9RHOB|nr:SDR family oxidoreductase [Monaibacterium marinum]SOH94249.1 NAD(P)-dependent dehydrogenase, short-chain alcohol dehydrogenase family [Monaibacterium marinum]